MHVYKKKKKRPDLGYIKNIRKSRTILHQHIIFLSITHFCILYSMHAQYYNAYTYKIQSTVVSDSSGVRICKSTLIFGKKKNATQQTYNTIFLSLPFFLFIFFLFFLFSYTLQHEYTHTFICSRPHVYYFLLSNTYKHMKDPQSTICTCVMEQV